MEIDDKSGGGYSVRKYDIHLLEQLNEEYRSKPVQSTFPEYDPKSQFEISDKRLRQLSEIVDLKEKKLLEVGCGRGYLSKVLADEYSCSVVGVDISEHDEWQDLVNRPNLDYLALDLSDINPFEEGSFDLIVSFVAWEHMMHPFTMLKECCRILKPEGKIYIHANLYRAPRASHLYRDIYFPFPHLLFPEEVIAEFCLKHGVSNHWFNEYYFRNKLTYGQYKEYFELLNLGIEYEQLRKTPLDMDFYERFKDKLEKYPRFDLELEVFNVLLVKDSKGSSGRNYLKAALTRERSARREEANKFKTELNTTKAGLSATKAELGTTKAELNSAKMETTRLRAELNNTKSELNTTKAELDTTRKEATHLRAELAKEKRRVQVVRNSLSFRLGHALVRPIRRPGLIAILLVYRLLKKSPDGLKRVILKVANKSKTLTSLKSFAEAATLSSAQQKQLLAVLPKSKTTGLSAKKAYVLEIVKERINKIKQKTEGASTYTAEPRRKDLKIAVIMDKFTYDCFKYEANLITFTPGNWKQVLSENRPHFLLIESAWHGNDDSWRYQIVNLGQKPLSRLPELVQWCKTQKIPTAFWCKEDPGHYNEFLYAARLFDYVFTTDADCVERYKKDLGHNNIFCLPFAVQPRIHNPIGSGEKIRDIAFAGSWYASGAADKKLRREQMANILAPALLYDVDIYDRHFSLNNDRYRFPEQYQLYIVGELPYDEMVYTYKMYRVFLNVSSVIGSPTMFPRRVLEILASGTCVLSGYSKGIENLIGPDIVKMPSSPEETKLYLEELLGNKELKDRLAHLGLRKVMKEHTYEQRLGYILDTMGINKTANASEKKGVSIITCTNKLIYMDNIFANYDRQQYEDKELIIILNNNQLNIKDWEKEANKRQNVRVWQLDESKRLGACLNFGVDKARFEYIAKFDDDDYYAPSYLEDLMLAFDYSNADIVGKHTYYIYFERDNTLAIRFPDNDQCFTRFVSGATMVIKRGVFEKAKFDSLKESGSDTRFQKQCLQKGLRIYSADRFNFTLVRKPSTAMHTWQATDDELLSAAEVVCCTKDYGTHVTC